MAIMNQFISNLEKELKKSKLAGKNEIVGCTNDEIEELENRFGVGFPVVYRDFLLTMGKRAGRFLEGTDAFFEHLPYLRGYAEDSLTSAGRKFVLPARAFVFASQQGYAFLYFDADEAQPDPSVFFFQERDATPSRTWPSLTAYFQQVLMDTKKLQAQGIGSKLN